MSEQNIHIWYSHNAIKQAFLERKGLLNTNPAIEYLIAIQMVTKAKQRNYFAVKEVQECLKIYLLPHHQQTVYRTTRYLIAKGYIKLVFSRKWFTPQKLHLTAKGLDFLQGFSSFIKEF